MTTRETSFRESNHPGNDCKPSVGAFTAVAFLFGRAAAEFDQQT